MKNYELFVPEMSIDTYAWKTTERRTTDQNMTNQTLICIISSPTMPLPSVVQVLFSWCVISWFYFLQNMNLQKLFFVTHDQKVLRDPRRTWIINQYLWF